MSLSNLLLQFVVLFAPLLPPSSEQVTPTMVRGCDPKVKDIYMLHDRGFKTIISTRTNPEEKKQLLCQRLGMKWINIPTGVFRTPTDAQIDEFRSIVNDPKNRPTYISCEVGMDRIGVYVAAYRMVDQHWSFQQMREEMRHHHLKRWWPTIRKYPQVAMRYAQTHSAD